MKRALGGAPYECSYEVRYRNGAISSLDSLDSIFEGENSGSEAVRLVALTFKENAEKPTVKIAITFADVTEESDRQDSMHYALEGEDRDWVFVASSQLSERIARIEKFNFPRLAQSRLMAPIVMLAIMTVLVFVLLFSSFSQRGDTLHRVQQLRGFWKSGELRDPVDTILRIEEAKASDESRFPMANLSGLLIALIGTPLCLFGLFPLLSYGFPAYNFMWGEYQAVYDRRKARMRLVFGTIIGTVVLGIVGNIVSKKLGW
jgi:hypothetical protein